MRKFRDIIESPFPVPTNALWLKGSDLKGFINGKWVTIGNDKGKITWNDVLGKPNFAAVATSGSYNDLKDIPSIPPAYTLPIASATVLGGVKSSTTGTTADRDYLVEVNADGTMKVNVPWTDNNTTYENATPSTNGLMSAEDKEKLDGINLDGFNTEELDFITGHNSVTSLVNIPVTKRLVIAEINSSQDLTLSALPADGREVDIIVHNATSSDISISLVNIGSNYIIMTGDTTLNVTGNGYIEINVVSDGTKGYIRSV